MSYQKHNLIRIYNIFIIFSFVILAVSCIFLSTDVACAEDGTGARQEGELFRQAQEALYTRHFEDGLTALDSIPDYSGSRELAAYIRNYISNEQIYDNPVLDARYIDYTFPYGNIYSLTDYGLRYNDFDRYKGLVYVPARTDSNTTFVQYFCGGGSGEDCLWYRGVEEYFYSYFPNSIIIFTTESGSTRMDERIQWQWDVMRHIAYDCGLVVHDLATMGSSNGAYTAIKMAYTVYADYGLKTNRVITLDTGVCWALSDLFLSPAQLRVLSSEETTIYAFEGQDFLEKDIYSQYVQDIIGSGTELIPVVCESGGHSVISENAYAYGLFSFAAGMNIYLPPAEYTPFDIYSQQS